MKYLWLLVLLGLTPLAAADPIAAREFLAGCVDRAIKKEEPIAEDACPGFGAAYYQSELGNQVGEGGVAVLTAKELRDLLVLQKPPAAEGEIAPDAAKVAFILQQLASEQVERSPGWWDRIKEWLRQYLDADSDKSPGWLGRLIEKLPDYADAIEVFGYICVAIVIALALAIIAMELRAAGVFKRWSPAGQSAPVATAWNIPEGLSLAAVEAAPLLERPSLLLKLLARHLVRCGQLRIESNLTHRELVRQAAFDESSQRATFEALAVLAESIRYGRREGMQAEERAPAVLAAAKQLHSDLETAPAPSRS